MNLYCLPYVLEVYGSNTMKYVTEFCLSCFNLHYLNFNFLRIKRLSFFATAGVVLASTTRRKFHVVNKMADTLKAKD